MTRVKPVMVQQLPAVLDGKGSESFWREIAPHLENDRPSLVLDFSQVRYIDSAGVEVLLRCVQAAMKRNGDVKLAAVPPEVAVMLEITRVDRLFEIFQTSHDAVDSFHSFSARGLTTSAPNSLKSLMAISQPCEPEA